MKRTVVRILIFTFLSVSLPLLVSWYYRFVGPANSFFSHVELQLAPAVWQVPSRVISSAVNAWRSRVPSDWVISSAMGSDLLIPAPSFPSLTIMHRYQPRYASVAKDYHQLLHAPPPAFKHVQEQLEVEPTLNYPEVQLDTNPQLNNKGPVKLSGFKSTLGMESGHWTAYIQDFAIEKMVAKNQQIVERPTEVIALNIQNNSQSWQGPAQEDEQQDEVGTKLSAVGGDREPVFYEYSAVQEEQRVSLEEKEVVTAANPPRAMIYENDERHVSGAVAAAISRSQELIGQPRGRISEEMPNEQTVTSTQVASQQEQRMATAPLESQGLLDSQGWGERKENRGKKTINLRATLLEGLGKTSDYPSRMDFLPSYNPQEVFSDGGQGKIEIAHDFLSGSILRGTVQGQQFISTRIEIPISRLRQIDQEVPLMSTSFLQDLQEKYKIPAMEEAQGILLVELQQSPIDFEINSSYHHAFYLDREFSPVTELANSRYLLLIGLEEGNRVINFHFQEGTATKIVHMHENEVYFDSILPYEDQQIFQLVERNLLSSESAPLDVSSRDIAYYDGTGNVTKKSVGSYQVYNPVSLPGMKHYFQLKHLKFPIYVGLNNNHRLEIPSDLFIGSMFDIFDIEQLDRRCLVQINLGDSPLEINVNGEGIDGGPALEVKYLDRDGDIGDELTEMTDYALVLGEKEGVFSMRIKYSNDTEFVLQSFCGENIYLVEQL